MPQVVHRSRTTKNQINSDKHGRMAFLCIFVYIGYHNYIHHQQLPSVCHPTKYIFIYIYPFSFSFFTAFREIVKILNTGTRNPLSIPWNRFVNRDTTSCVSYQRHRATTDHRCTVKPSMTWTESSVKFPSTELFVF